MNLSRRLACSLLLAATAFCGVAQAEGEDVNGVMVQAWYWDSPVGEKWWDKLSGMMPQLREWGVTALWVPPPTKGAGGGYSSGYDTYDLYDLGSKDQRGTVATKWGTKEEFLKMVGMAHSNGMDVYADIVVNHRAGGANGGYEYQNLVGSEATGRFTMAPWDFHHGGQGDWDMDVAGQRDLAQGVPYVRDGLYQWIRWFDKQSDVDGYRIDATKHMPPDFVEGLLYQVQEGMGKSSFAVGEYFDGNPNTLAWWVNAVRRRSSTFDFTLHFNLHEMAHGGGYYDMRQLRRKFYDTEKSVTFVNNHDTFRRGNGMHIFQRTHMAYAFIMAAEGYPSIYWQDLFDDNGDVNGWMTNLIWIHHMLANGSQLERWADDDLYVLEREGSLLAGLNDNNSQWRSGWVRTAFGPNVRLHDYANGVGDLWTNDHGYVRISVPPGGYVMYGRDGLQQTQPNPPARRTTQEHEGAADMDTRPAGEWWSDPIRFVAEQGEPIWVNLWLKNKSAYAHLAVFDQDGNRVGHARGKGHIYFPVRNPSQSGWYQVRLGMEETPGNVRSNFHLEIDYQAPRQDPGPAPHTPSYDLLPLRASSTGP